MISLAVTISIHAPAKGATAIFRDGEFWFPISIHAPAKGATLLAKLSRPPLLFQSTLPRRERQRKADCITDFLRFQSTLPRRERPAKSELPGAEEFISIHAPAKGATFHSARFFYQFLFQSTLPRRERPSIRFEDSYCLLISIHAPAKGATSGRRVLETITTDFNPRSREGSDEFKCKHCGIVTVFQSTLPRRERPLISTAMARAPLPISIHAPAKGATR